MITSPFADWAITLCLDDKVHNLWLRYLEAWARSFVDLYWPQIDVLAGVLIDRGTPKGADSFPTIRDVRPAYPKVT